MLNDREKLNAVAWQAKKESASYGQFSAMLSEERKRQIYWDYEQFLNQRKEEEQARLSRAQKRKKK